MPVFGGRSYRLWTLIVLVIGGFVPFIHSFGPVWFDHWLARKTDVAPPATSASSQPQPAAKERPKAEPPLEPAADQNSGLKPYPADPTQSDLAANQPQVSLVPPGMKLIPGWLVEIHEWNANGRVGNDPLERVLTRSCKFAGNFRHKSKNNIFIYKFSGLFRAKQNGRYVFGQELTCGFNHGCVMEIQIDGHKLINFKGESENQTILKGIEIKKGDHIVNFVTYIPRSSFIKYSPESSYKWTPLVQGPNDFNPREYRDDEIFAVVNKSVNAPVLDCDW